MLHALDSQILLELLTAIGEHKTVELQYISPKTGRETTHTVCPLKIYISTQGGRQYLLCYHYRFKKLMFFRLDFLHRVTPIVEERRYDRYLAYVSKFQTDLWGTSTGVDLTLEHLEMTIRFEEDEPFIPRRLEREKRNGLVEMLDAHTCRYTVDTYDASEMLPWIRTFTGRIVKLECSDENVTAQFYRDLDAVAALYGREG